MLRIIYSALFYIIQPLLLMYWLFRKITYRHPLRLHERYALGLKLPNRINTQKNLLIHAASVGEVVAVVPLILKLKQNYPTINIIVTTSTATGSQRVKALLGEEVSHCYFPYDLPDVMRRFIHQVNPQMVVVVETEIWPNFIYQLNQRNISLFIINGRISDRSYSRYLAFKRALTPILRKVEMVAAQDRISTQRYQILCSDDDKVITIGNLKYDIHLSNDQIAQVKDLQKCWQFGSRPVWIAASTHKGEDEIILKAHRTLLAAHPDLLLLLVPRHPQRFNSVASLIEQHQLTYGRRSQGDIPTDRTQVMLIDTMGELVSMYGVSDIAFIGGSLVPVGGHNPLEALLFGLPIIVGKYTANFKDIVAQLRVADAICELDSESSRIEEMLANLVSDLLNDLKKRQLLGANGEQVLKQNQGALPRLLAVLSPYLDEIK